MLTSLLFALFAASAPCARAGDPEVAAEAWRRGRVGEAREILARHLGRASTDPESLLAAARLAAEMEDADLLEAILGRAEALGPAGEDPRAHLAVGLCSLGLARARLRDPAGAAMVAFLFADAEERAGRLVAAPGWAGEGLALLAETRLAQGDLDGALEALEGRPASGAPEAVAAAGWLLHERALRTGLDDAGRPTPEGRTDLEEAVDLLQAALAEDAATGGLPSRRRFQAHLTLAWAAHRLGDLERAAEGYVEAQAIRPADPLPLRGLQSLLSGRPAELVARLEVLLERVPRHAAALEALALAHAATEDVTGALGALEERIALDPRDPAGWILGGRLFAGLRQWEEARRHYGRALELEPTSRAAVDGLQRVAVTVLQEDTERGLAFYERLLDLRPQDPYVRNNLGFVLREIVSPWTAAEEGGVQRIRPDAPPRIRELLVRCRDAYAEAAALIPEEDDGRRDELEDWNLAGIVNDYGLILHYFADVQDAVGAERQYLRALRMTDFGFKDTYLPNVRRLYAYVLPDCELRWYRIAREAKEAILREVREPSGAVVLVPDEAKRGAAAQDEERLRAAILELLARHARQDGRPWPPE